MHDVLSQEHIDEEPRMLTVQQVQDIVTHGIDSSDIYNRLDTNKSSIEACDLGLQRL
jgi:hypothetical protein